MMVTRKFPSQRKPFTFSTFSNFALVGALSTSRGACQGHSKARKSARTVAQTQIIEVTDPDDERLTMYKPRSKRDCTAYANQKRSLAEAAMRLHPGALPARL